MSMNPRKVITFVAADLISIALLLLLLSYYGMSHIFLLGAGLLFLTLSFYDSRTGRLSDVLYLLFGQPREPTAGKLNWLSSLLSIVVIAYSIPLVIEHGLVNYTQRFSMQEGLFPDFALGVIATTAVTIAAAVWANLRNMRK